MKIEFIKDYTLTIDNPDCTQDMFGCQYSQVLNWKAGQVVSGGIRGGNLDSKNFYIDYGNFTNAIPLEYVKVFNDDGTPVSTPNTELAPQTFLQKHKNHLLILSALIIGYFAYKKFNK